MAENSKKSNIIVIGRELPKGFCQRTDVFTNEEYWNALDKISACIPKRLHLRTISMTSSAMFKDFDCDAIIPSILKYSKDIDAVLDPEEIFNYCQLGEDSYRPAADFVIFKGSKSLTPDRIAVVAYSKTAPVLVFEDDYGNIAIGTILKPQLIKYGEWVFNQIYKTMVGPVTLTLPICTKYDYPDFGTIPDYIRSLAEKVGISDVKIWPNSTNYYGHEDNYNNAVVVW